MSGTAQIFPVVGSSIPVPLPTKDVADGTPGSAASTTAMQVAGTDGTNLRALLTDTSGRANIDIFGNTGAVLDGAPGTAVPPNAVQIAGTDGTDLRVILTDTGGQVKVLVQNLPSNTNTVTGDSPTIITATTTNGATQTNGTARGAVMTVILGTVTGTLPTLSVQLQWSPDGGTTWLNYGAATSAISIVTGNDIVVAIYPTDLTLTLGGAGSVQLDAPLPRTWRLQYITTGTGISVAIASVQVNYCI